MVMDKDIQLIKDGRRIDGRKFDEMRPIKMKVGILKNADGSAMVELGNTRILAAVYGPKELHPQHLQDQSAAILQVRYSMAPFSTSERVKPGPSRRSMEISLVARKALEKVIFLEEFPLTTINIFIEVLEAQASTRVTGITAASLALADAGIPMKGLISACSVGKVNGHIVLDVTSEEDSYGDADIPVAMINGSGKVTLLQLDGDVTEKELEEALKLAKKGCKIIYEKQREALEERFRR